MLGSPLEMHRNDLTSLDVCSDSFSICLSGSGICSGSGFGSGSGGSCGSSSRGPRLVDWPPSIRFFLGLHSR